MRTVLILGLIAFLAVAGYGIHRNPPACEKLGLDLLSDTLAIYVTPTDSDSKPASTTPDAPPASAIATSDAAPAPSLPPAGTPSAAPKLPVVAPASPVVPIVTPAPVAVAPAAAPAPPAPQYPVGYVATVPAAAIPQPSPLPAAAPQRSVYPTFTDYSSGLAAARKYHVPMLVLFTGSDWCQYCQMLEREVLSSSDFTSFSSTHFVFVTIDDLRNSPVTDEDKRVIGGLEQKFNITGFPTLVVVDENEKEKGRAEGYDPGSGPSAVIQQLSPLAAR